MLVMVMFVSVGFGLAPEKSYAADNNASIKITAALTSYNITSADKLSVSYNIEASSHIVTYVYLQQKVGASWVKTDYAYSGGDYVYDSNYEDGGTHITSGTISTNYAIPGGTYTFRLATEGNVAVSSDITVKVSKVTPKIALSGMTINPSTYEAGKGIIESNFTFSGYTDVSDSYWVLEKKSGSKWKAVSSYIYTYSHGFSTKQMKIGSAATYRLRFKGDDYANEATATFSLFKKKITVQVTGKKSFKSLKSAKISVKLSKKTSGAITVYLKGKEIGTMTFKNKKTVKIPVTFYGSGKGKLYVKYTSGNKTYKNATSKKVSITVKR
jgi:hypothetical protein